MFYRNLHRYQDFFLATKKPWIWIRSWVLPLEDQSYIPRPSAQSHTFLEFLQRQDCTTMLEMEVTWSSQSSRRLDWEIQIEFILYMFPVNFDKCQIQEINRQQTKSISSQDKIKQTIINWISYELFHNSSLISTVSPCLRRNIFFSELFETILNF